jgi:hypothetical protein
MLLPFIVFITLLLFFNTLGFENYHVIILALTGFSFVNFLNKLGNSIPIAQFIGMSGVLLWLTVPVLMNLLGASWKSYNILEVSDESYYSYVIPATIALIIGLEVNVFKKKIAIEKIFVLISNYLKSPAKANIPFILLSIGIVGRFLAPSVPIGFAFVFYLLSEVAYVALMYAFFLKAIYRNQILIFSLILMLISVITGGFFGPLVWWGVCIVMILSNRYKFSLFFKFGFSLIGLIFIIFLHILKIGFREQVWFNSYNNKSSYDVFYDESLDLINNPATLISKKTINTFLFRANQAHIVSMVMKHMPEREPFANGETIFQAVLASIVPRFLWPDKPKSGGHENMLRFAGTKLVGTTSMDIGQVADGYANFGRTGGIIFLFFYGLLINFAVNKLIEIAYHHQPTLLLWIPFIFIQTLKVEVSIETTLNAMIKGGFFVLAILFLFRKLFNIRL